MSNGNNPAIAQYARALVMHDGAEEWYADVTEREAEEGPLAAETADAVDARLNAAEEALGYASGLIADMAGDAVRVEYTYAKIQHLLSRLGNPDEVADLYGSDPAAWAKQAEQLREQFTRLDKLAQQGFLPSAWRAGDRRMASD